MANGSRTWETKISKPRPGRMSYRYLSLGETKWTLSFDVTLSRRSFTEVGELTLPCLSSRVNRTLPFPSSLCDSITDPREHHSIESVRGQAAANLPFTLV